MQTNLADFIKLTPDGQAADQILRSCVHCGFCLATCPTYQLLGDELDSPRGRIYLIKQMLEGAPVTAKTQLHLDRCLTCRACETTCPSGVQYGHLLDIGRNIAEQSIPRGLWKNMQRWGLRKLLSNRLLFGALLKFGQLIRPVVPTSLRQLIPARQSASAWPNTAHARRMLILDGCVQPALSPNINAATARVLDRLGIQLIRPGNAGCCGALDQHLNAQDAAMIAIKRNIDAWWPLLQHDCEAIVITASGCGVMVKDYGHVLRHDPEYAAKAARISGLTRDLSEIIAGEQAHLAALISPAQREKIAFHAPCTLQHGQMIVGVIERMLSMAGFQLTTVADSHLCCGSSGTYSILQPELARQLRSNKLDALNNGAPQTIATANIGCLTHLQSGTGVPVRHWIELIDEACTRRTKSLTAP
ncbi:glycolate oxidase subunit GlcF [Candidatus Nitrotoga sp. 1052]|uniref:glycolate oxidase subunit GlcF n=1 Tax=Candidatus Nitrotoga sp. 1052 TaxID=2886964 RepID=UPI001EF6F677|nr:glycolate oxidase subunit GlcF [Candidatus Nitrotoga sp. 1052]CAH1085557.1 glycolate dehydrogenase, putative iron-sulfur subunit [Candidatus Nitrotoga sp. 1052]